MRRLNNGINDHNDCKAPKVKNHVYLFKLADKMIKKYIEL